MFIDLLRTARGNWKVVLQVTCVVRFHDIGVEVVRWRATIKRRIASTLSLSTRFSVKMTTSETREHEVTKGKRSLGWPGCRLQQKKSNTGKSGTHLRFERILNLVNFCSNSRRDLDLKALKSRGLAGTLAYGFLNSVYYGLGIIFVWIFISQVSMKR